MADVIKESYPEKESHKQEWNRVSTYDATTPIARSWRRIIDRGINVGSPVGEFYDYNGFKKQVFQHAYALLNEDANANPNQIVEFHDARGIVGHESGLN